MALEAQLMVREYSDGRVALLFAPPKTAAFAEVGLAGSLDDWESVLRKAVSGVAPESLDGVVFTSEDKRLVVMAANPASLHEIAAAVECLLSDSFLLRHFIRTANGMPPA